MGSVRSLWCGLGGQVHPVRFGDLTVVWIWLYLVGCVVWFVSSRRTVRRLGYDRGEVLRHWTYTVWRLAVALVLVLSVVVAGRTLPGGEDRAAFRDAFVNHSHALMGYTAVRIAMLALLGVYTVIVWRRLTRTTT